MEFHPLADLLPLVEGDEFRELVEDVKANGLLEPIVSYEGKILDGRNRWRACKAARVSPTVVEWSGECGHPAMFVVSKNINRRHLTPSQRAAIVKRHLLPAMEAEAAKRKAQARGEKRGSKQADPAILPEETGEAREQAAKAAGVSPRLVSDAKAVDDADPALGDEVLAGTKTLGKAKRELKERDLGIHRVPQPFAKVVAAIIHQNGVPRETAETIVKTATHLPTPEIERLHGKWESGDSYQRAYVKSRLAQVQPPADPRCATLITVRRELRGAAKLVDDEWSERILRLATDAQSLRDAITEWRKQDV